MSILTTQLQKSHLVTKFSQENKDSALIEFCEESLTRDNVKLQVKQFLYKLDNQVSFHEPHCANYRLFNSGQTSADNPFAINIQQIHSAGGLEGVEVDQPVPIDDNESA